MIVSIANAFPFLTGACRYLIERRIWPVLCTVIAMSALAVISNPSTVICAEPEDILASRIRAYWEAKSNNNFQSAYEMESPRFRKELSLEKYKELNQTPLLRISRVGIQNIVIEGDRGRADVVFHLDIHQGSSGFSIVTPKRTDEWERIDGVWYKKYFPPDLSFPLSR
ncbi:MAG: hypothetical protein JRG73_09005 [Deltaproteobacteria bacterium]|nr:hypothetical protein [Deltaproteobacteria bacterium]